MNKLIHLRNILDPRGNLTVGEAIKDFPFEIKRFFMIYQVPLTDIRGEHAHRKCHQLLVAARGRIRVDLDDGHKKESFFLTSPTHSLHIPPMHWGVQYDYSPEACLIVFASEYYDDNDYIRDYSEFLKEAAS